MTTQTHLFHCGLLLALGKHSSAIDSMRPCLQTTSVNNLMVRQGGSSFSSRRLFLFPLLFCIAPSPCLLHFIKILFCFSLFCVSYHLSCFCCWIEAGCSQHDLVFSYESTLYLSFWLNLTFTLYGVARAAGHRRTGHNVGFCWIHQWISGFTI